MRPVRRTKQAPPSFRKLPHSSFACCPCVHANPHLIKEAGASAAQQAAHDHGIFPGERRAKTLIGTSVLEKRTVSRKSCAQLNTPSFEHAFIDPGLKRLNIPRSRLLQHGSHRPAALISGRLESRRQRARTLPGLDRVARDRDHVGARLERQAAACNEGLDPFWPGIVGRSRKADISKTSPELLQEFGGTGKRLHRIKGIEKASFRRRRRHELCDALGPLSVSRDRPFDAGAEAALLTDQTREEAHGQTIGERRGLNEQAQPKSITTSDAVALDDKASRPASGCRPP